MKRILSILAFLLCVVGIEGASIITATITVTNTPSDGDTITVNGSARTWKDTVASPASQITIGASIGANATNMFNQFSATPFTTLTLSRSGTNAVKLRGIVDQALTASIAGTWGEVTYITNTSTPASILRVPHSAQDPTTATANLDQLVTDISDEATSSFAPGNTALQHYADLTTSQTLSNKLMFEGTSTNAQFGMLNAWITNAYFYGALNVSNTAPSLYIYDTDGPADEKNTLITSYGGDFTIQAYDDAGNSADIILQAFRTGTTVTVVSVGGNTVSIPGDASIGGYLYVDGPITGAVQSSTLTLNTYSGDIGSLTNGTIKGSTITGATYSGTISALSGGTITSSTLASSTVTSPTISAATIAGTTFTRANHTAMANGANAAVDLGSSTFVKVKAGPTAAFSIAGIANGANGDFYRIVNWTGQNMTISHDSGSDPTPGNRIYTTTGADIATTGNGIVDVWYDSEESRWIAALISQ